MGKNMKKILPILLVGVLMISGFGAAVTTNTQSKNSSIQEELQFSNPVFTIQNNYLSVQIPEVTSYAAVPGDPVLPVYTKMLTFPVGTRILDVSFVPSSVQQMKVKKEIIPAAQTTPVSAVSGISSDGQLITNNEVYRSTGTYPLSRLQYQVGAGVNGNERVIIVSLQYYPILYAPLQQTLLFTPSVQISVTYEESTHPGSVKTDTNLLVIAPAEYTTALQPLIDHKNQHGFETTMVTIEWIAVHSQGRDLQEQIKYAIKDAVETDAISYVLLVGGVDQIPIRQSAVSFWGWDEQVITDLYYSDLYDVTGNFSSWDANHNNIFGEDADHVDHYPDVYLGRLACASLEDVNIVVDKIIHYETETYGSDWFNQLIVIGGNTFRWSQGNDGEENNQVIMNIMSQFTPTIIWTSKGNFNRRTISGAITQGAGFLDYSGHGFEHGMMTYTPTGLGKKFYFTTYIKDLKNGYKLPIIFFDACLTAKIDFVLQDFLNYRQYRAFDVLAKVLGVNTSKRLPCYGWAFVNHESGGAIATIGATRTAYGGIDSGAGKIATEFFSAYDSSQYLGEMITQMQNGYITDVPGDGFTLEEFILLGDPSLMVGGYPS
jgi:hypothetical protein